MWKAGLLLVLLFAAGHFAVSYLRTNPLAPRIEGSALSVETTEHEVHFTLEGPLEGRYLVASATSQDFADTPANAALAVVGFAAASDYLNAHPDQHGYGSASERQIDNLAAPLDLIAADRRSYAELRRLIDLYAKRARERGAWVCLSISGDVLRVTSAESLRNGSDATSSFARRAAQTRMVLARRLGVEDCVALAADG